MHRSNQTNHGQRQKCKIGAKIGQSTLNQGQTQRNPNAAFKKQNNRKQLMQQLFYNCYSIFNILLFSNNFNFCKEFLSSSMI